MGLFGTWSAEGNKKSHKDFFNSLQLRSFLTLFYEISVSICTQTGF